MFNILFPPGLEETALAWQVLSKTLQVLACIHSRQGNKMLYVHIRLPCAPSLLRFSVLLSVICWTQLLLACKSLLLNIQEFCEWSHSWKSATVKIFKPKKPYVFLPLGSWFISISQDHCTFQNTLYNCVCTSWPWTITEILILCHILLDLIPVLWAGITLKWLPHRSKPVWL